MPGFSLYLSNLIEKILNHKHVKCGMLNNYCEYYYVEEIYISSNI